MGQRVIPNRRFVFYGRVDGANGKNRENRKDRINGTNEINRTNGINGKLPIKRSVPIYPIKL